MKRYIELKLTPAAAAKGMKLWAPCFTNRIIFKEDYAYMRFGPFDLTATQEDDLDQFLDLFYDMKVAGYRLIPAEEA